VVSISQSALRSNLEVVKKYAPHSKIVAMVKANAYGHHIDKVISALEKADIFAVAKFSEIAPIRALTKKTILLLSAFETIKDLSFYQINNIEVVLHNEQQLQKILNTNIELKVWLKVDTGMHRLGFTPEKITNILESLEAKQNIKIIALMSHFARSDEPKHLFNEEQQKIFDSLKTKHKKSLANSAAILALEKTHYDFVRPGIMLYGISPFAEKHPELKAVMHLSANVIEVKKIAKNESVGYSQTWQAQQDTNIAIVNIGYGDGYPRSAKNGTPVIINQVRCALVGRVSMDLICVDIGDLAVKIGDEVTLWGNGLPIEEIAKYSDTIAYELTCQLTNRMQFL
jgi:alanine racemase